MRKMITTVLCACLALAATSVYAQEAPRTVITATLKVEQQTIRTGPYARFAQKYLGVIAPLTDKRLSTVMEASLGYTQGGETAFGTATTASMQHLSDAPVAVSHTRNPMEFTKVPVDKRDFTERSLEESAREAAATIFAIRKHRMELVTGMAGENVFGAGLPAALAELDRQEEEYLSLFMGKQAVRTVVKVFSITPEAGETSRIVCRWSETDGLLPTDDLSGSPVVLEMMQANPMIAVPVNRSAKGQTIRQYFPGEVSCRLTEGKSELARAVIPVYQMGTYADVPTGK